MIIIVCNIDENKGFARSNAARRRGRVLKLSRLRRPSFRHRMDRSFQTRIGHSTTSTMTIIDLKVIIARTGSPARQRDRRKTGPSRPKLRERLPAKCPDRPLSAESLKVVMTNHRKFLLATHFS
jgi:hypothetical protein